MRVVFRAPAAEISGSIYWVPARLCNACASARRRHACCVSGVFRRRLRQVPPGRGAQATAHALFWCAGCGQPTFESYNHGSSKDQSPTVPRLAMQVLVTTYGMRTAHHFVRARMPMRKRCAVTRSLSQPRAQPECAMTVHHHFFPGVLHGCVTARAGDIGPIDTGAFAPAARVWAWFRASLPIR